MSAGVATAVAIVSGTRRALVQVNGQWYDLPGLSRADLLNDPRYAGRLTFASITNVSQAQAGAAPAGIDGSAVALLGAASSAPVRNVQMPAEGQVRVGTQSKFAESEQNAAITAVRAVVRVMNAAKAVPAAAPEAALPAGSATPQAASDASSTAASSAPQVAETAAQPAPPAAAPAA